MGLIKLRALPLPNTHLFPPKSSKWEPAACSKTRIDNPAWSDSSGKPWLYYQKTAAGWVGVTTIVSSTLDQATATENKGGRKVLSVWPKHLPLRFTRLRRETGGSRSHVPTDIALIASATLALKCLTHGKHPVPHQNIASKGREHGRHCRWPCPRWKGKKLSGPRGAGWSWVGKLKPHECPFMTRNTYSHL